MNKFIALSMAGIASAVFLATPALSQNIIVQPGPERAAFVAKVSQDLDRQLENVVTFRHMDQGEGIAIVRFESDAAGEPTNLQVYRKSGSYARDRQAVRAVKGLSGLSAIPGGLARNQVFQANIIFADDRRSHGQLADTLAKEEAKRLARGDDERHVLAFGVAPDRSSS